MNSYTKMIAIALFLLDLIICSIEVYLIKRMKFAGLLKFLRPAKLGSCSLRHLFIKFSIGNGMFFYACGKIQFVLA